MTRLFTWLGVLCLCAAGLHAQTGTSPGTGGSSNSAPTVDVRTWSTATPVYYGNGTTIQVNYGDSVAALNLEIWVRDLDGDYCSVSASVSNLGSTGINEGEWAHQSAVAPYTYSPTSGVFNTPAGVTHQVTLTVTDSYANSTSIKVYIQQAPQQSGPVLVVRTGGAGGAVISSGYMHDFGAIELTAMPSAPLTIYVENLGTTNLTLGLPSPGGMDFVVSGSGFPMVLPPSAGASFTISFHASSTGTKTDAITFAHGASGAANPFVINVEGEATTGSSSGPGPGAGSGTGSGGASGSGSGGSFAFGGSGSGGGGGCTTSRGAAFAWILLLAVVALVAAAAGRSCTD